MGNSGPTDVKRNLGIDFPEKSNFKQSPGSLHKPVPRLSACRGPHPHHTALSFSSYPALDPAQKCSEESVTDWKDVSPDINYLLLWFL